MTLIGLLRAVNVGGTRNLPMSDLRTLCVDLGFTDVTTYIQSGNVVFRTRLSPAKAKAALEKALTERLDTPATVIIRTPKEVAQVDRANPWPDAAPNQVLVLFLDVAPPKGALAHVKPPGGERLTLIGRELFVHFPNGMGASKLKIPFADVGTGRNLNTVRKLLALSA
ncbi:MAG: DUF1697 domain-containing protein [Myxococcaceae bacterium]|nr:DUF1697 domain-containing protein [Myxococcaceae bacterium]